MSRLLRRPSMAERLATEKARTGLETEAWWHVSDCRWWCRIVGMSGHWETWSESEAERILLAALRQAPDRKAP